jgi:5-methyltetrahydropteroyltriglutamate--homocysteine methyltransferase
MKRLTRAVVGSFPSFNENDIESSILKIIDLQLKYGIDIISPGEQRYDMIAYFASIIPGLKYEGKKSYVTGKIKPPEEFTTFSKIKDLELVKNYLEQRGETNKKIKITITGPITLGFTCATTSDPYGKGDLDPYSSIIDVDLYADVSAALNPIAEELQKRDVLVQIDEPGFGAGYINYRKFGKEIIQWINEYLTPELKSENTIMHVCGRLTKNLFEDILVKFENIETLNFAFDGAIEKDNINIISRKVLEDHGKKLGLGCISGANAVLSDPKIVKANIAAAVEKIGLDNIKFISPDCGLKVISPEKAEMVLKNMVEGAQLFEETI